MLLRDWAIRYAASNLGLSDQGAYQLQIAVRRLEAWAGKPVHLADLSTDLVAGFLRHLLNSGQAPATVNSKRRCLLTLWRSAADEGLAPPVGRIKPAREPQRIPDSWTLEQVAQLFAYTKSLRGRVAGIPRGLFFYSLLSALYDTGERVGAVLACRPDDFGGVAGTLRIPPESHKCRRERLCRLSSDTVTAVVRLISIPVRRQIIWPWPHSRRHLFRTLRKIIEDAGLPTSKRGMGLTHRLRRTAGSLVEANGGCGEQHLGNSRRVFEAHYLDPRLANRSQLEFLPRPKV